MRAAMAVEEKGLDAGTASSVQGFVSITTGVLVGGIIGQAFDGSTVPMIGGFLAVGVLALICVAITTRGRLFAA